MTTQDRKDILEQLIDDSTLRQVISALSEVCEEKAEHIRTNWQDNETAKPWQGAAARIYKLVSKLEV